MKNCVVLGSVKMKSLRFVCVRYIRLRDRCSNSRLRVVEEGMGVFVRVVDVVNIGRYIV